jgi:O-antigen/teichoic acid export membrane protein
VTEVSDSSPTASAFEALLPRLREAGTHTLVYGIGSALQAASGFILIPLYTRHFDPATYGVFALLTLVSTFAASGFSFGAASSLARSYYDYEADDDRRRVVATSMYLVLAGAVIVTAIGATFGASLSRRLIGDAVYAPELRWMLVMSMFAQMAGVLFVVARFRRRSRLVVATNIGALAGTSLLIWYLLQARHLGLMAPILGMLASQVAQVLWLSWALREYLGIVGMRREIRPQLAYGLPAALVGVLYYAMDSIDRFLLNRMTDTATVGVYSLGYRIAFIINLMLVQPFGQIWTPMRMEYRLDPHAPRLFAVMLRYYLLAGFCFTLAIGAFAPELVDAVSGRPGYAKAYEVIAVVMVGYLVYGTISIVDPGIIFQRRVSLHVVNFAAGLALNLVLNWLMIPALGIFGAGLATLITYTFVAVLAGVLSNRLYPMTWDLNRIGWCAAVTAAALWVASTVRATTMPFLAGKIGMVVLTIAGLGMIGLTGEERAAALRLTRLVGLGGARR